MNLLSDVITYVRRIIKSATDSEITEALLIDYINRFWSIDVDARIQSFDLKTSYQFQTVPGVDKYNMPLYEQQVLSDGSVIGRFPKYQGFTGDIRVKGVPISFATQRIGFFSSYPDVVQTFPALIQGDGGTSYSMQIPLLNSTPPQNPPFNAIVRGHVDITGIIASGSTTDPIIAVTPNMNIKSANIFPAVYITAIDSTGAQIVIGDSGQFLSGSVNNGLLIVPEPYAPLSGGYSTTSNVVNYFTGEIFVNFPVAIPAGNNINVQCVWFNTGLPRSSLWFNNVLTFRVPPDQAYQVDAEAYLTPAAFMASSESLPFGYMAEYIARGAARKILSDTGDWEQFSAYEPLFREQEALVWKRSQRQFTSTRTQNLFTQGPPYSYRWTGVSGGLNA